MHRPTKATKSTKSTKAATPSKASTGADAEKSTPGTSGIVTDNTPGRAAPAGAIPPRPRKKKRR
jgi:hypothetical protein